MPDPSLPKFYLGEITILPHAEAALRQNDAAASTLLFEHAHVTPDEAIDEETPVVSNHRLTDGTALIIITDTTRTHTFVMTPADAQDA